MHTYAELVTYTVNISSKAQKKGKTQVNNES